MIKAYLIDADGVALNSHEYFSERYARERGVSLDQLLPFFKHEFAACTLGKADLREVVSPYLRQWGWTSSVDDFLHYWFSGEGQLNEHVLSQINKVRVGGKFCYLVSNQEKYRSLYLMEELGLGEHFDGSFFSCDLGLKKSDPEFFITVLDRIGFDPEDVAYYDDEQENVDVAARLGIQAQRFTGQIDLL